MEKKFEERLDEKLHINQESAEHTVQQISESKKVDQIDKEMTLVSSQSKQILDMLDVSPGGEGSPLDLAASLSKELAMFNQMLTEHSGG